MIKDIRISFMYTYYKLELLLQHSCH